MTYPHLMYSICCAGGQSSAVNGSARRKEHWPQEDLQKGFKTMQLFRGVMRVNASDKSQAYVTLKGLTADIFVKVSLAASIQRIQRVVVMYSWLGQGLCTGYVRQYCWGYLVMGKHIQVVSGSLRTGDSRNCQACSQRNCSSLALPVIHCHLQGAVSIYMQGPKVRCCAGARVSKPQCRR